MEIIFTNWNEDVPCCSFCFSRLMTSVWYELIVRLSSSSSCITRLCNASVFDRDLASFVSFFRRLKNLVLFFCQNEKFTSWSSWLWYLTLSSCRASTLASNCLTRSESDSKVSLNWSSRFDRCRLSISACSPFNVSACWDDKNWQSDRALSSCWMSP